MEERRRRRWRATIAARHGRRRSVSHVSPRVPSQGTSSTKERSVVSTTVRPVRADDYPAVAAIVNAREDDDHRVDAGELVRLDERLARHDAAFRRVAGVADGVIVATGYVCSTWGGSTEPGRFWVNVAMAAAGGHDAIDIAVFDDLYRSLDGAAREVWTCTREDHARHLTYLERFGFTERFRSWGSHLELDSFDPSRWTDLMERLAAEGVRLVLYPDLHGDPERDAKLTALQDALEADVEHFEPIVPKRIADVLGPEAIPEALVVAVASDGRYVGLACLLGSRSDASLACGLTGVVPERRRRGIATALKTRTAEIARGWGAGELNAGGGGGTDAPIVRVNRAIGFGIEPPWVTLAKAM